MKSVKLMKFASIIVLTTVGCSSNSSDQSSSQNFANAPQPFFPDSKGSSNAAAKDRSVLNTPSKSSPLNPATTPSDLLTADDFTYLGSYPVNADSQMTFGMGLTVRYVNKELRFLTTTYSGSVNAKILEFKLPTGGYSTPITAAHLTNEWDNIWFAPSVTPARGSAPGVGSGDQYSLWWEDQGAENGRLWTTHCIDYPDDVGSMRTQTLTVRNLKNDGTVSNIYGEFGFEGIGARAIYGGVQKIPESFRTQFGITQPYLIGWGGYTSRMSTGLIPSLGLMAVAIPDVTSYPASTIQIPQADFKVIADHRSGTTYLDWYKTPGSPINSDRGFRNTNVINYYENTQPQSNPFGPPVELPAANAQWLSAAPDGKGRMVWGDSFYNTGNWIVGEKKQGFIAVLTAAAGKAYYQTSTLHSESREAELQIFDPRDFGQVIQGKKNSWNVQPSASKMLTGDLINQGLLYGIGGNSPHGGVAGAAYDPVAKILWLWCPGVNGGYSNLLVAYKVNA